jgi:hypothetical protein
MLLWTHVEVAWCKAGCLGSHASSCLPCIYRCRWFLLEYIVTGKGTPNGACLGAVCGLVGITPAAG